MCATGAATFVMSAFEQLQATLKSRPQRWLVTGGAGFIGSHVIETLLALGHSVRVLDNLSTGKEANLKAVCGGRKDVEVLHGDIADASTCRKAATGMDRIIHLAALGSVPLSLEQPELCHASNVTGTLNVFIAAHAEGVKRVAYASSSAVYGDDTLPHKKEESIGQCLSPYAASKRINEVYAQTWRTCFGLQTVGLRFFNVFGPRQDPKGAYAAVIPQWIFAMKQGQDVFINGDGENSRDFCFVGDIVQSLLLAAMTENEAAFGNVFNVGLGRATSLNELFGILRELVQADTGRKVPDAIYRDFRAGDIRHSCADAGKIQRVLGFAPGHTVMDGLRETVRAF
jgi:UDP-N-acetylglucosamine 4-epimerase